MKKLKFKKVRSVKSPQKGNPTDAGIDFFIPDDFKTIQLRQGDSVLIPSGIILEIPEGWMGVFLNKSGVASKQELIVGAQVIDAGYSGEVHFNLFYVGNDFTYIAAAQKICQLVLLPVPKVKIQECKKLNHVGLRGVGGFGSTGI